MDARSALISSTDPAIPAGRFCPAVSRARDAAARAARSLPLRIYALEALRTAAALGRQLSATVVLLHVEPPPRGDVIFAPPRPFRSRPPPAEESWCELASGIRGEPVLLHYATGDASEQIVEFARKSACDLIVLGSGARRIASFALGSVAAGVLVHAHCPVLIAHERPQAAASAFEGAPAQAAAAQLPR
jgi:nucleotide-binding universal stress UspA family protein